MASDFKVNHARLLDCLEAWSQSLHTRVGSILFLAIQSGWIKFKIRWEQNQFHSQNQLVRWSWRTSGFQRQLDVSQNQFVSEWSASNSQMGQDKITQSKDMFMFQNQFHNCQDVSTWISLPKAKGNTGFRINDEITISKIIVAESMSWSQSNRHNPRTKDVSESAPNWIQDHSQRTSLNQEWPKSQSKPISSESHSPHNQKNALFQTQTFP